MKTFLKITGAIIVVLVMVFVWALKKVDYSPYFFSDYYKTTRARLDSVSGHLSPVSGKVMAGFGKESITPGLGATADDPVNGEFVQIPLAGYGDRKGKPAEGIHDSIFVKTVALQVGKKILVLVGSDLLIIPPVLSEGVGLKINKDLGIGRDQIFFSATHTHSGPGAWSSGYVGKQFAGDPDQAVVDWLVRQFSKAIENAVKDLKPGKIGSGKFEAADFISNRLVGELGRKDPEFIFMVVTQDNGKRAVLGSFDAHATTLGGWNMQISGDYPGYWQRKVEREGADMAVFFAGSVGSHSPRTKGEKFEKPEYIGEALADSVIKYAPLVKMQDSIVMESLNLRMDLPEFHVRVSDGKRVTPALARKLFPDVGDAYVQGARIGHLIWITAPCDFSGEMAINYKNALCKNGLDALVTSFNGAYVGYIIPGKYYHLNEYESRLMSWFGPYMGPYFDEMIRRIIKDITSQ